MRRFPPGVGDMSPARPVARFAIDGVMAAIQELRLIRATEPVMASQASRRAHLTLRAAPISISPHREYKDETKQDRNKPRYQEPLLLYTSIDIKTGTLRAR